MLAGSVDPVQIALEQSDQGLHCLPIIIHVFRFQKHHQHCNIGLTGANKQIFSI